MTDCRSFASKVAHIRNAELCKELKKDLTQLEEQLHTAPQDEPVQATSKDMQRIRKALERMVDTSGPKIAEELLDEFVEVVTPMTESLYRWKLNFGQRKAKEERTDLAAISETPILNFKIDYETAKKFRQKCKLPIPQFRRSAWYDLEVEVYL